MERLCSIFSNYLFDGISLSSVIYYYFEASDNTALAWIGALSLFITGVIYLCIYFGFGKKLEKEEKKLENKLNDEVDNTQGR